MTILKKSTSIITVAALAFFATSVFGMEQGNQTPRPLSLREQYADWSHTPHHATRFGPVSNAKACINRIGLTVAALGLTQGALYFGAGLYQQNPAYVESGIRMMTYALPQAATIAAALYVADFAITESLD